jgi:plasmid maintenance system killer protein
MFVFVSPTMRETKKKYEVWGSYSPYQFRDEWLEEFDTEGEADQYKKDFESVSGRSAYIVEC